MAKHKVITFAPIKALATLIMAVSLLTVNAEFIRTIHPAFIPVTRLKSSYGKNFQPAAYRDQGGKTEIWETEPARPLI